MAELRRWERGMVDWVEGEGNGKGCWTRPMAFR